MIRRPQLLMIVTAVTLTGTLAPTWSARGGPVTVAAAVWYVPPWLICDLPPDPQVTCEPFNIETASPGNYAFAVDATLNGTLFASAGSAVAASLDFSAAPDGSVGLVPGTGVALPGTTLLHQQVDVNFNIVEQGTPQGTVVLLAGELKSQA
jgi:hypothetical protein